MVTNERLEKDSLLEMKISVKKAMETYFNFSFGIRKEKEKIADQL